MTKVSVIMPVYNTKEDWLREAIESILNQTFTDFEFIILDDKSTNNAIDVINEYAQKDNRIKIIEGEHKGLANALNKCIDESKGEYIARMDADDISLSNRLIEQVNYLDNNRDISIISFYYEKFPKTIIVKLPVHVTILDMFNSSPMCHPSVMMRRSDIKKYDLKYDEKYIVAQDYELWSRAVFHVKMANIDKVLLRYRVNENGNYIKNKEIAERNVNKVKTKLLNKLTIDREQQESILKYVLKKELTFIQKIFSITNIKMIDFKIKMIKIVGLTFFVSIKGENNE